MAEIVFNNIVENNKQIKRGIKGLSRLNTIDLKDIDKRIYN
mgnify:FL=1